MFILCVNTHPLFYAHMHTMQDTLVQQLNVRVLNHAYTLSHNRQARFVIAKALSTWSSQVNEQMRMRNLVSKLIRRMQNAGISQAWQTWRGYMHSVLGAREQEERQSKIQRRFLLKILNARMYMVIAKWIDVINKKFMLRTVAAKAVLR